MTDPTGKMRIAQERQRLKAFLDGGGTAPFVMVRLDDWCDCDVVLATGFTRLAVLWHGFLLRIADWLPPGGAKSALLRGAGVRIGSGVSVAPGATLDPLFPGLIEIGDGAILGMGCRVLAHECNVKDFRIGRTRIGPHAVIGAGATVRMGVTIGARATVGCNSFANADVPDDATVGGVPARLLKID